MKVDYTVTGQAGDWDLAVQAEQRGYDGVWVPEIGHDPFPSLAVAATRTERVQLGTNIAVAFARNPMSLAVVANDIQLYSRGPFRARAGLADQGAHRPNGSRMPWSQPAARMREYILAMRAIWDCWANGEPLTFVGEFYTHTLMTPFFSPGPNPYGHAEVSWPLWAADDRGGRGGRRRSLHARLHHGAFHPRNHPASAP